MPGYMYIWEYHVRPEHVAAFERAYHTNGTWVALFCRGTGHQRTGLHRDLSQPLRYVTIDYWDSPEAWETFRADFAAEFDALDVQCENYTESEREIGRFSFVE